MKKPTFLAVAILLLTYFCYCSMCDEFHFRDDQNIVLKIYSQGNMIRKCSILGTSPIIDSVRAIIESKNEQKQWTVSFVTYAPLYEIKGQSYSINFQTNRVIVNFKNPSGKYKQLVSALSAEEFERIKSGVAKEKEKASVPNNDTK